MRIFSIAGNKDTGKTTLTTRIIKELKDRGFSVGTIKHSHHSMVMDKEGTDTFKHKTAGAEIVVGVGSTVFFNVDSDLSLDRILFLMKMIDDPDFVIIEGFKDYPYPKIITSSNLRDDFTVKSVDAKNLTDENVKLLVDLIEKYAYDIIDTLFVDDCGYVDGSSIAKDFISDKLDYDPNSHADVSLSIDGINIGLNPFVDNFIKKTVLGMLDSLKTDEYGVKHFNKIELSINNKDY